MAGAWPRAAVLLQQPPRNSYCYIVNRYATRGDRSDAIANGPDRVRYPVPWPGYRTVLPVRDPEWVQLPDQVHVPRWTGPKCSLAHGHSV